MDYKHQYQVINGTCQAVRCGEIRHFYQLWEHLYHAVQERQALQLSASSDCHQVATDNNNNISDHEYVGTRAKMYAGRVARCT